MLKVLAIFIYVSHKHTISSSENLHDVLLYLAFSYWKFMILFIDFFKFKWYIIFISFVMYSQLKMGTR